MQPLGLQPLERMIFQELKASGKGKKQIKPLLDGLATEITQMGMDRFKVLARVEQFATQNGLSSAVTAAIAAAKSPSG